MHPHDGQLKAYLRGQFPAVEDIEDVVQESYLRVWKARAAHPINCVRAFLFQVARNLARDMIRRDRRSPFDATEEDAELRIVDPRPNGADLAVANDVLDQLAQAIAALPERCREVFILQKIHGVSQREIAQRLGLSERTVEKHCGVGLRHCETHLRKHGIDASLE